jgi:hypothetical protein
MSSLSIKSLKNPTETKITTMKTDPEESIFRVLSVTSVTSGEVTWTEKVKKRDNLKSGSSLETKVNEAGEFSDGEGEDRGM